MDVYNKTIRVTVITPTYNRAYTLPTLYESLKQQSSNNFIWIIIDDGSSDNTEIVVKEWVTKELCFEINYIKQKNSGKHKAINNCIKFVNTEYSFIVDSDDYLDVNAISLVEKWVDTINNNNSFAGVSGMRKYYKKDGIIGQFPFRRKIDYVDCTNLERKKNKLQGDKAEVYKTELLLKYPFPEFEGEVFITESTVWDKIAFDGYKIRWFKDAIVYCEYLEDGLTNLGCKRDIENFEGFTYFTKQNIDIKGYILCIKNIAYYTSIATEFKGMNYSDISKKLNMSKAIIIFSKFLWYLRCLFRN